MKRFWLLIVVVIVGFGVWLYFLSINSETKNEIQSQKEPMKLPEVVKNKTRDEIWETLKWDNENGKLGLKNKEGAEKEVVVDLEKMVVMIPYNINNLKHDRTEIQVLDRSKTITWQTAFCPGDEVKLGMSAEDEVILVMNRGYRYCGFKGE